MAGMIDEVCAYIHNYFEVDDNTGLRMIYPDTYTISGGVITLPFLVAGNYFRIMGSELNDGVYKYPITIPSGGTSELEDETFTGVIWKMRPPKAFLKIVTDIEAWLDKYGETMRNPYQSEDVIGVYRYTKMTTGKVTGDYIATWQNVYKDQLNEWRKLS